MIENSKNMVIEVLLNQIVLQNGAFSSTLCVMLKYYLYLLIGISAVAASITILHLEKMLVI
ncbi:MAG: hypothetical protein WCZ90_14115 [Melioribacteraceae bacterium]